MSHEALAATPAPPYTAVIFTSVRTDDQDGYEDMGMAMYTLAMQQPGFLGAESTGDAVGITVSYWESPEHARSWKQVAEHLVAQQIGRERWYSHYRVRIATVEREYGRN